MDTRASASSRSTLERKGKPSKKETEHRGGYLERGRGSVSDVFHASKRPTSRWESHIPGRLSRKTRAITDLSLSGKSPPEKEEQTLAVNLTINEGVPRKEPLSHHHLRGKELRISKPLLFKAAIIIPLQVLSRRVLLGPLSPKTGAKTLLFYGKSLVLGGRAPAKGAPSLTKGILIMPVLKREKLKGNPSRFLTRPDQEKKQCRERTADEKRIRDAGENQKRRGAGEERKKCSPSAESRDKCGHEQSRRKARGKKAESPVARGQQPRHQLRKEKKRWRTAGTGSKNVTQDEHKKATSKGPRKREKTWAAGSSPREGADR